MKEFIEDFFAYIAIAIVWIAVLVLIIVPFRSESKRVAICESLSGIDRSGVCYTSDSTVIPARILMREGW